MTLHALHPDVHDYGLVSGCDRCEELSLHPDQLDYLIQDRLLAGKCYTELEKIAATTLRSARPHPYEYTPILMPSCFLCGRPFHDPLHEAASQPKEAV